MKMRPSRPLSSFSIKQNDKAPKKLRKMKSSAFNVPTRARVQTINPLLYNPVHRQPKIGADVAVNVASEFPKPATPEKLQVNSLQNMFKPREDEGTLS